MSLILHLSDLHLSLLNDDQIIGDYKAKGFVTGNEHQNRLTLLRSSLGALDRWLIRDGMKLDAIVITGDVSLRHDENGFAALTETLAALEQTRPPPEQIVVVPGNHDVRRATPSSTEERYEHFCNYVRTAGYVTPLLEGIDLDDSGNIRPSAHLPILEDVEAKFVIVAVNSADYSGRRADLSTQTEASLAELRRGQAHNPDIIKTLDELESWRDQDIARVSQAQIEAVRQVLSAYSRPSDGGPLRILAIHHQLLPVSPSEEFKAFETLTNLGQVREFLAAQEVNVVLHGHKHQSVDYLDTIHFGAGFGLKQSTVLVSSAATVWKTTGAGGEFARLIRIETKYPRARRILIESLPATATGAEQSAPQVVRRWTPRHSEEGMGHTLVRGSTVDEVYELVLARFDDEVTTELTNLVCEVRNGQTARCLPACYPELEGTTDRQRWLDEIVHWWQREDPGLLGRSRRFNHGERLRRLDNRINQIDVVVKELIADSTTTRAIVQLIDIARDDLNDTFQKRPSFFSLHFLLRKDSVRHETLILDCIAYFRKQQVRMWWPVNMAEIAALQEEVVTKLRTRGSKVDPGAITTFAALAIDGTTRPRVIVPRIDRLAQDRPAELWAVAYDLFFGNRPQAIDKLMEFFDDWRPAGEVEPDGTAVSLVGLNLLAQAVGLFANRAHSEAGQRLATELNDLADSNASYATTEDANPEPSQHQVAHGRWSRQVATALTNIQALVETLQATPDVPPMQR